MATMILNGQEYTLPDNEKLNAIQAAQRFGVEIPYYCWHPALSVVANCRMCEIEVGSKDPKTGEIKMIPKMVPGCQTPARDGTVLVTNSTKVKDHQKMIMEFLLLNHPLDCPVCDQAGECGLQDYSYEYGQANHRFVEERNVNPRKDVSDLIQLNQDRCIMCTRCVRFTREITQTSELQVTRRGSHAEIDIFPGIELDNPLAGNVVDLCPVGALLDKDFLHKQRVWFLAKHDSICAGCSTGCNISAEENRGQLWRFKPRYNPNVNDYWICDAGRYSYKVANDVNLLNSAYLREHGVLGTISIDKALTSVDQSLKATSKDGGKIGAVLSPFLTVEEAFLLSTYIKQLSANSVLALGPVPIEGEDKTYHPDKTTGRTGDVSFVVPRPFTIHAEKCPNRHGVEAVLKHFQGEVIEFKTFTNEVARADYAAIYLTAGGLEPFLDQGVADLLRASTKMLIVQDVHVTPLAQLADIVLPGATFAEKSGSFANADRRLQSFDAALAPRDGSLADLDIFAILLGKSVAPILSNEILAELAEIIPDFAVAKGGKLPEFGAVLGTTPASTTSGSAERFADSWTKHRISSVGSYA